MNGVGLEFNHLFGYGVLDAGAMVALAKLWKSVPPRFHCEAGSVNKVLPIPTNNSLFLEISTNACKGSDTEVNYNEHIQSVITLNSTRRGDITLYLISPMGTRYVYICFICVEYLYQ
jgi:proprotein convertase subtilisin/kexin type 2